MQNYVALDSTVSEIMSMKLIHLHYFFTGKERLVGILGKKGYKDVYNANLAAARQSKTEARIKTLLRMDKLDNISFWVNVFATLLGPKFFYMDSCIYYL